MGMGKGGFFFDKVSRCFRTVFFMVAMVASLLVSSLPVLVAIGDVMVPCVLISSFTCVSCYGFRELLGRYAFKSSLTDIPLVSVVRSLISICVYTMCDGPALSHGPYFGSISVCSIVSILLLSIKACVFTVNSQFEAEASSSLSRQRLHLKKSWGMPVLFLSSVVFALGHIVVAYRTSYRARRKLMFHRVDPEAALSCKNVFSGYQKVPRSPTPTASKTSKSDSEVRRNPIGKTQVDMERVVRLLADMDSLFIICQGLTVHYKLGIPGPLPNTAFQPSSPRMALGRLKHFHRSYSIQFHTSSLYAPLLDGSSNFPVLSEGMPVLSLNDAGGENKLAEVRSGPIGLEVDGSESSDHIGIVLIHGFGGGVFSWRHVVGPLARRVGCTVAAFDRPGWGLSSRPRRSDWEDNELPNPYSLETQVDLLLSFCCEMGFSSVVLVGHDDGGLLSLKAAEKAQSSMNAYNVTIRGVVLVNVSLSREVVPAFARILLRTSLGKKHLVRPLLRTEITQVVNRRAWYDATKLTTEVLSLYKAPLCVEGWDEALHEIGRLSHETVLTAKSAAKILKAVESMPVLVIAGAEDSLVSLKSSQVMASKLVNSRLVAISGCGHLPHEECPEALLAALSPFITRLLVEPNSQNREDMF